MVVQRYFSIGFRIKYKTYNGYCENEIGNIYYNGLKINRCTTRWNLIKQWKVVDRIIFFDMKLFSCEKKSR